MLNEYENDVLNSLIDYFNDNAEELKELQTTIENYDEEAGFDWLEESGAFDYVTGDADGSYTMNRVRAKEEFENLDGYDYLGRVVDDGYIDDKTIVNAFIDQDWEALDVICRVYAFDIAAREFVDKVTNELNK